MFKFLILALLVASDSQSSSWERCACEHDTPHSTHASCNTSSQCQCTGQVRYGHADTWVFKVSNGTIACSNGVFTDSVPGQAKECQCGVERQSCTTSPPANGVTGDCPDTLDSGSTCQPDCNANHTRVGRSSCFDGTLTAATCRVTWQRCACEHDTPHSTHASCNTSSLCQCTGQVRYGHADTWSDSQEVDDSIDCSNTIFDDPAPGQAKECQCYEADAEQVTPNNQACAAFTTDATCTAASGCEWSKAGDQWKCQDSMYYTQADSSHRNVIASLLLIGFTAQCFV